MIRKIVQTVRNYARVSGNIAALQGRNVLPVFARILASRFVYGMGPDVYDRRRFSEKKLREARDYLTLREREDLQKSLCPATARDPVENKLRFHQECLLHGLPTPRVHGAFLVRDSNVPPGIPTCRSRQELEEFIGALPDGAYVVKPIKAGHGLGVSAVRVESGKVTDLAGRDIAIDAFHRQMTNNLYNSDGYLFQEFVRPHRDLRPVMPGPGLGTFRVVTFIVADDSVRIPFAVAKIPIGESITDNFDAGYSGNWVCPVDVETGRLGNAVGKTTSVPAFSEIETRNDTGARFKGTCIPFWGEVLSTVVRSARTFSELRTIGWDVAVTDSGVTILEANWDWGENIIEVAHNRGLRYELTELTKESLKARKGRIGPDSLPA